MIVLGLLLSACCAAFAALAIAYNTGGGPEYTVRMFGNDVVTLNTLAVFAAGLALALLFCFGLLVAVLSARAAHRRRHSRVDIGPPAHQWTADTTAAPREAAAAPPPTPSPPQDPQPPPPPASGP